MVESVAAKYVTPPKIDRIEIRNRPVHSYSWKLQIPLFSNW